MKRHGWTEGNRVRLLENGEEYFPRVFEAIRAARFQVLIETFILFEDKVGRELKTVLIDAVRRGVSVIITVDGWGSPPHKLSDQFIHELSEAGVDFQVYGDLGWLGKHFDLVRRLRLFRRMHRKIVVVDGSVGFIGGINFSADHLSDYGPESKQDYSVELRGPIVDDLHRFLERATTAPVGLRARWRHWRMPAVVREPSPKAGDTEALLVTRDNRRHTNDIESHYRVAIRAARQEVLIACAYFFPSYSLLRELRDAARRGVQVRLILQGKPDMAIVPIAARLLYNCLIKDGVGIYEYRLRPLHAKVALVDEVWATVGSSNLEPFSLSLQLEANVMLRDRAFNRELRAHLVRLIEEHCVAVEPSRLPPDNWWRAMLGVVVFHFLRHFPWWVQRLPTHRPRLTVVEPPDRKELSRGSQHD
jgi:cardiolipin synthase A/B